MPRRATENHYCRVCLKTQAFVDLVDHLLCAVCSARLERLGQPATTKDAPRDRGEAKGARARESGG